MRYAIIPAMILGLAAAAALGSLLSMPTSMAGYREDEKRDFRIKGAEMDIIRTEERLQKQIDELRARVEKIEQR